jgi:hypothetical protein
VTGLFLLFADRVSVSASLKKPAYLQVFLCIGLPEPGWMHIAHRTSHIAHRTSFIAHFSSIRVWNPDLTCVAGGFIKLRLVLTPLIPGSKWLTRSPQSGFTSPRTASFCSDCDPPLSLRPIQQQKKLIVPSNLLNFQASLPVA